MRKLKATLLFLFISGGSMMVYSQSGTVASGGNVQNASGSISYSIGQVSDAYTMDADGTVSEGIQQPYEIFIITSDENPEFSYNVQVFPNPTLGELRVQPDANLSSNLEFTLLHMNGKIISTGQLIPGQMSIPMEAHPAGSYFLTISVQDQFQKTFKVVKTQ